MIVSQFHIERVTQLPAEADPVLVIHADAVLAVTITLQRLQPSQDPEKLNIASPPAMLN